MVCIRSLASVLACTALIVAGVQARDAARPAQEAKASLSAPTPVNLNQATAADLERLPGIGPAMATRILEYRQKAGGFKKIEDLMNVSGIGERNFLKLRPLITVGLVKTAER